MPFKTPLVLEDKDGLVWKLHEPLVYLTKAGRTIIVPVGFVTDLASIPRGLWNLLPKSGAYNEAGVVHDYLYRINGVTRKEADEVFLQAMEELGVGRVRRTLMWSAVRMFAGRKWKQYREEDEQAREYQEETQR